MSQGDPLSTPAPTPLPRLAPGFPDIMASAVLARQRMIATICDVYARFGFTPLETPAIEYLDVLGKFLPESHEPGGGVFAFKDDDGHWLALRYDLTAPLSRVVAQYGNALPAPFRRYQVGPVWRREKPGPGRFRQFYQCDFDTAGSASPAADAEVCALLSAAFSALGIPHGHYQVRVNNRKVLNGVLETIGIARDGPQQAAVLRAIDKLDRLGLDGVRDLLGAGRHDPSGDFTKGAGLGPGAIQAVLDFVSAGAGATSRAEVCARLEKLVGASSEGHAGIAELTAIGQLLDAMELPPATVAFDPTVVRGLDYYTGPVFEAVLTFEIKDETGALRRFGSVAGGGRYDGLVRRFTGTDVPCTGASIGVDRLLAALAALEHPVTQAAPGPVVVTVMEAARLADYQRMAAELRSHGIAAELYLGPGGFRAQMKYADKRGAPVAVIAGADEFTRGEVTLKDLRQGAQLAKTIASNEAWRAERPAQRSVPRGELCEAVRTIIAAQQPNE